MSRFLGISIAGLYEHDPTIFDDFTLPYVTIKEKDVTIDKDILIANILMELNTLEILYPNSEQMKFNIKWWSKKMQPTWNKLLYALSEEYDPLHNYDRTETKNENENGSQVTNANDESDGTNEHKVAGFNSTSLADQSKDTTHMESEAHSGSTNSILRNYTLRAFGNIGVTTSQQMLQAEMDLRAKYNIYDLIIMDFKLEFCLTIY